LFLMRHIISEVLAFDDDVGRPIKIFPLDLCLGLVHFPRMSTLHRLQLGDGNNVKANGNSRGLVQLVHAVGRFNKISTLALGENISFFLRLMSTFVGECHAQEEIAHLASQTLITFNHRIR